MILEGTERKKAMAETNQHRREMLEAELVNETGTYRRVIEDRLKGLRIEDKFG